MSSHHVSDASRSVAGTPVAAPRTPGGHQLPPFRLPTLAPLSTPIPEGSIWNTPRFDIGTPAPRLRSSRAGSTPPADQIQTPNAVASTTPTHMPYGWSSPIPEGSIWGTPRFGIGTVAATHNPPTPMPAARQNSLKPSGTYILDLPGFASKHPSLTTPHVDRITFHISENRGIYWGALTADDGTVEVSLKIERLPIAKRPTFSFTWCGHREASRALIGPACTGIFHFEGENDIMGHFKSLYDFRTEFTGRRNTTSTIPPLAAEKIEDHWTACHERLARITNIEEKYSEEQTKDELLASFVAGDDFINRVDLDCAEILPMLQQTRSYFLSTSHNISKPAFDAVKPQHLALQDLTLCRDQDGTMWGAFKIQNTKGVLNFDQFAHPLDPRLPHTYQFEWYGVETVGNTHTASQRSVRHGTGYITCENLGQSMIHGRFNPPDGAKLNSFSSSGGLADAGFWNASWQQPYDYYGYANDAKWNLLDDQTAGRRISRSLPSMKGEWAEIRALWGVGAGGPVGGAGSSSNVHEAVKASTVAARNAAAEALIDSWTYEEDSEGERPPAEPKGKKRAREGEEEEVEGEEEGRKKRKKEPRVRFAAGAVAQTATTTRKSGRKRTPSTRYGEK
ncbi:hypothetical protein BU16DRAFT_555317 [Lophium mytilinum]|uniref:Uncharacterized protein n=1 Tax=Lophium mytilinum TaxID=390894 RepID=A0A6A6RG31_9PEZI|nr:hypothetical protein BU16DRAFT_555317 [Lophium mytilinum]